MACGHLVCIFASHSRVAKLADHDSWPITDQSHACHGIFKTIITYYTRLRGNILDPPLHWWQHMFILDCWSTDCDKILSSKLTIWYLWAPHGYWSGTWGHGQWRVMSTFYIFVWLQHKAFKKNSKPRQLKYTPPNNILPLYRLWNPLRLLMLALLCEVLHHYY